MRRMAGMEEATALMRTALVLGVRRLARSRAFGEEDTAVKRDGLRE
jgi:hypothetical protein